MTRFLIIILVIVAVCFGFNTGTGVQRECTKTNNSYSICSLLPTE